MIVFIFLAAMCGGLAGFWLATWLNDLPTLPSTDHEFCDQRYRRMVEKFNKEIADRERELQRLIAGMS